MTLPDLPRPSWSTTTFGDSVDTSPMELSALGEHLSSCKRVGGRIFALQCGTLALHGFVSARFMTTTLLLLALALGVAWLM